MNTERLRDSFFFRGYLEGLLLFARGGNMDMKNNSGFIRSFELLFFYLAVRIDTRMATFQEMPSHTVDGFDAAWWENRSHP